MAHIIPTNTLLQGQPAPVLTAYWNTEKKAYAIAQIPCTSSTDQTDHGLFFQGWNLLIEYLRDEAINLRLVCRTFAHPLLRDFYLNAPIDPPRPDTKMNAISFRLIQKIMTTNVHIRYSNPMIHLNRSLSLEEFRAFQFHFPNVKVLPWLVLKKRILPEDHFPCAKKIMLSYCNTAHITLNAFPNVEQFCFTNTDKNPPVLKDWDPLFKMQPVNSLLHLKQIEFEFTPAYGFFSQQGLEALIRSAPNLVTIIYATDKRHITAQELRILQVNHPHIEFRNLAAYI